MLIELSSRERNAVLAGLRLLQQWQDQRITAGLPIASSIREISTNGDTERPLDNAQIDELCDRANTGEDWLPLALSTYCDGTDDHGDPAGQIIAVNPNGSGEPKPGRRPYALELALTRHEPGSVAAANLDEHHHSAPNLYIERRHDRYALVITPGWETRSSDDALVVIHLADNGDFSIDVEGDDHTHPIFEVKGKQS